MRTKCNFYRVLIFHSFQQAQAKLVGFFFNILTVCRCGYCIDRRATAKKKCRHSKHSTSYLYLKRETVHIHSLMILVSFLPLPLEVLRPLGAPAIGPPPRPVSRSTAALFTDMEKFLCKYKKGRGTKGGGGEQQALSFSLSTCSMSGSLTGKSTVTGQRPS